MNATILFRENGDDTRESRPNWRISTALHDREESSILDIDSRSPRCPHVASGARPFRPPDPTRGRSTHNYEEKTTPRLEMRRIRSESIRLLTVSAPTWGPRSNSYWRPASSAAVRRTSRCSSVRSEGMSTSTSTYRSPCPSSVLIPCPFSRSFSPGWVPSGIVTLMR